MKDAGPTVYCNTCKCRLALNYVRYRDTAGNPYCMICYQRLLV